jgi:type IV pilus assembly protein PilY1
MRNKPTLAKKALVAWLAYWTGFSPMVVPVAYALPAGLDNHTSADFSDVPLPAKKRPNPNLIFAIDDSGSMDGEISLNANDGAMWYNRQDGRFFGRDINNKDVSVADTSVNSKSGVPMDRRVPDGLGIFDGTFNFNKTGQAGTDAVADPNFLYNGNPVTPNWKKYVYLFPNGRCGTNCDTRSYADTNHDHFAIPPTLQYAWLRSALYNKQYYNPQINYDPWKPYNDGTNTCPSGTGATGPSGYLCTPANADPGAARSHPIYGSEKADLKSVIKMPDDNNKPDDTKIRNRTFRMYPGMIIPKGARYTVCTGLVWCNPAGGSSSNPSSGWVTAAENTCITGRIDTLGIDITKCVRAGMAHSTSIDLDTWKANHVEAQIEYLPGVYYREAAGSETPDAFGPDGKGLITVPITNASSDFTHMGAVARTDCTVTEVKDAGGVVDVEKSYATCSKDQEMQNFANWYQYYRKRHMSLAAAFGNALDGIRALRGGEFVFNSRTNVTMYDFDLTTDATKNQRRLLGEVYRVKGDGGTPTRESLDYIGLQYRRTGTGAPITHKCQFNGGFVITDGFATSGGPTGFDNYDGQAPGKVGPIGVNQVNPTTKAAITPRDGDAYYFNQVMGATSILPDPTGSTVTAPFADKWSNTLADIAMKHYSENLRPDLPKGWVPTNYANAAPDADKNPNLHMSTFGLILGLRGVIFGVDAAKTADPFKNPPDWDAAGVSPRDQTRNPTAIDELWHATINGRGAMLAADSPEQTRSAIIDVVNNVQNRGGAAAAVSVSNANPVKGDNFSYQSSYNSGSWYGDLNKFEIDLASGEVSATPLWKPSPRELLAEREWSTRYIATYSRTQKKGIPFDIDDLDTAQKTALAGGKGTESQKVDFLRGDRSFEGDVFRSRGPRKVLITDPSSPNFGKRAWVTSDGSVPDGVAVLADIVNAEPVIVTPPKSSYFDAGYASFKLAQKDRQTIILQGANDGMVHAFSAVDGAELWAYIPSYGFDKRQDGSDGLKNLTDKEFFTHKFYVDATPVIADVDFSRAGTTSTAGTPDWRTIAVGGLGKGGRGWFALDVTSTTAASDAGVASKILWEFPSSANATHTAVAKNVGYSFGKPIVTKTKAAGWVVIIPAGYENGDETGGDGRGYLYVLNPANGNLIAAVATDDAADALTAAERLQYPLGLAHIVGYADNADVDNTLKTAYGGDLHGNVWRFDFRGAATSDWKAVKLATLASNTAGTTRQPITSEPELGIVSGKLVVYIGTGKYFGDKDIPDTTGRYGSAVQTQTIYALWDDLTLSAPNISSLRSGSLVGQTAVRDSVAGTVSINPTVNAVTGKAFTTNEIFGGGKRGWYVDLPESAERVVTNPSLGLGVITFTTNIPSGVDPCLPGGSSWVWSLDYRTGTAIVSSTTTYPAARSLGLALASRPVLVKLPTGKVQGLIRKSDATTTSQTIPTAGGAISGKRKSWREVILGN